MCFILGFFLLLLRLNVVCGYLIGCYIFVGLELNLALFVCCCLCYFASMPVSGMPVSGDIPMGE